MKFNKSIAIMIVAAALSAGVVSCSSSAKVVSVSAQKFEQGVDAPGAQILDVRRPSEYENSHIEGATNIDVNSADFLSAAKKSLKKNKSVYVYCRSGKRSMEAADVLVKNGYNVINLEGGINSWKSSGLPVISDSKPD